MSTLVNYVGLCPLASLSRQRTQVYIVISPIGRVCEELFMSQFAHLFACYCKVTVSKLFKCWTSSRRSPRVAVVS